MTEPLNITLANAKACKVKLADNVKILDVPESKSLGLGPHIQFSLGADVLPVNGELLVLRVFAPDGNRMMQVQKTKRTDSSGNYFNSRATEYANTFAGLFGGTLSTLGRGASDVVSSNKLAKQEYTMGEPKGVALTGEVMQKLGICLSEGKPSDDGVSLLNYKNAQAIQQHFSHAKGMAK